MAYRTILNLAIGLSGYNNWLRHRNPATYAPIEDAFFFLQKALFSARGRGTPPAQTDSPRAPHQPCHSWCSAAKK
jgi:hypothetical protein